MANETLKGFLTGIANAIRSKDKTTAKIPAQDMEARIRAITTGVDTSDATATADDIIKPLTAYVKGSKVVGALTATSSAAVTGSASELGWASYNKTLTVRHRFSDSKRTVFSAGGMLQLNYENGEFGDAKEENVLPGVTYTSNASGIKQYGNASGLLSSNTVETYRNTEKSITFPALISQTWNDAYEAIDWKPRITYLKVYCSWESALPQDDNDAMFAILITPLFLDNPLNVSEQTYARNYAEGSYTEFAKDTATAHSLSSLGFSFTQAKKGTYNVTWNLANSGEFADKHFLPNIKYGARCLYY